MFAILIVLLLSSFRSGIDARLIVDQQEIATTRTIQLKQQNPKDGQAEKSTGTVPILRVDANYSSTHFPSLGANPNDDAPDIRLAVVRTNGDPDKKYLGVGGWPSLYKPNVDGPVNQYSAARIKLLNGPDSVEVGWMVNPAFFKDKEAHFYVRFKAGEKECINTECPGFVHVAKDVELGFIPDRYSTIDGERIVWKIFIDKHDDGNWWVSIDEPKKNVGYWPKNLFTGLSEYADQVEWGGEARVNSDVGADEFKLPEMGNGRKAIYDTKKSASFQCATLVNGDRQSINPPYTEIFESNDFVYNVLDAGNKGDYFGRLIFFGGPNQND